MNRPTARTHADWIGSDVYDSDGDKIGSIDEIYVDDRSGRPEWLTVSTGWFGTSTQFVPIAGSTAHDDGLRVPYTTDHIKDAPSVDADQHLDASEERRLYDHYGLSYDATDHEIAYGGRERADAGFEYRDTDAIDTRSRGGDTEAEMSRSEERLDADKVERDAGPVRLRKYVVTRTST